MQRKRDARAARTRGFSLVEALICLAVMTMATTVAMPNVARWLRDWQSSRAGQALRESLDLARVHALRTSARATLCVSADGIGCLASTDWSAGWIVFSDRDGNGLRGSDEPLLHVQPRLPGLTRIAAASGSTQRLVFLPNGLLNSTPTSLAITSAHPEVPVRRLVLNRIGRARLVTGA
ncbi:GspH/FimT family pseudopilin [uncultured Pseudacidovorax sp.]|uniref:GspH/FimT family pseudopilin n=1 Tax=uncultured Pseudacidovorax sp. TaxID=679313 RepID=UPI00345D28C2